MLNKLISAVRWRYELYAAEYIDLFGSVTYFCLFWFAWFKYRKTASVIYVFANKRNVGDYISHQGVQQLVTLQGPMMLCTPVAQKLYHYQLNYLRKHNPSCHCIIGGGGLLQGVFTDFWQALVASNLDFSLLGVGLNRMPGRPGLKTELLQSIFAQATILGLRDPMTVALVAPEHRDKVRLHTCPAHNFIRAQSHKGNTVVQPVLLHMLHEADLRLANVDIAALKEHVQMLATTHGLTYVEATNMNNNFTTAIAQVATSQVVVTSRLHGCIMSYATGRPCIGIACDAKLSQYIHAHTQYTSVLPDANLHANISFALDCITQVPVPQITSEQLQNTHTVAQEILQQVASCR